MKLQFKVQQYQTDAVDAVVEAFAGQPKHDGISYFLLDMKQPGVTVRPLRQMTGGSEFNEVFFDQARTAADKASDFINGGTVEPVVMVDYVKVTK